MLLLLEHVGQLTAEGCLTGALQTGHQDDGRTTVEIQSYCLATHQFSQLIMHNLHHQLSWLHGGKHVHTQGLLLHGVGECLGHFIVHVGIQQCTAHIFQSLSDINLSDFTFAFQDLERPFKSVT